MDDRLVFFGMPSPSRLRCFGSGGMLVDRSTSPILTDADAPVSIVAEKAGDEWDAQVNEHALGDLTNADLSNSDLSYANLKGSKLGGANLGGAKLDKAIWIDGSSCAPGSVGACITH